MRNYLFLGLLVFLTSGCLLKPYEKPPAKQETPFSGAVSLVDLSTLSNKGELIGEAQISAQFVKPNESPSPSLSIRRFPLDIDKNNRAIQCQLISNRIQAEPPKPVSVGKLEMGTPTSSQKIEIPEVSTGMYQKDLLPHFAPGIYFLSALGKEKSQSFSVDFSMPEEVRAVRVNDHGLEEGPAIIQKSADFLLEVDPVTAPNDMNILEMVLITQNENQQRALVCGALESGLEVINSKTQMVIPSAQMSGLYASAEAVLQVFRVNSVGGVISGGPSLRIEGLRAWSWPSLVAE
ncbi:MAG: hypothetical protein EBQ92_03165 [Proteobacteria bacterium]|nr:hypothetical protein [Pseudomonadota bacterium]